MADTPGSTALPFRNRARAGSFGDDAEQYDRVRPAYPAAMVDELMTERPTTVLDVGCGTGITSRLFVARQCDVQGVEPDPRMASVARRHGITVEEGIFESWDAGGRRFDLLVSGQAWHWVDPHVGAAKAAEVLRPGGRIGLFWNQAHPYPEIGQALQEVYARHAPELGENSVLLGQRDLSLYGAIADAARESGGFDDLSILEYEHDASYPTAAWLELTMTHSDHRTMDPNRLAALLDGVRDAVDNHGGHVRVLYATTLVTGHSRLE